MNLPDHPFGLPFLGLIGAYAIGCFNTGYYLVRWKTGGDLRASGSGNAGSKNAGRLLGLWGFGAALLGDMLKGALVMLAARAAGASPDYCILALLAVTVGHNWPVQLGLRGGKGLATSFGALLVFDPILAGGMLGLCGLLILVTRRFTLSASIPYLLSPVLAMLRGYDGPIAALLIPVIAAVVIPHRESLRADLQRRHATLHS